MDSIRIRKKYRDQLGEPYMYRYIDVKFNILLVSGIECGYPANIKHGGYTLINNTVSYLSQVLYSCDEGYEMTGKNLSWR